MALIMVLLFKTPLRKLVIMRLDQVKGGQAYYGEDGGGNGAGGVDLECVQYDEDPEAWDR